MLILGVIIEFVAAAFAVAFLAFGAAAIAVILIALWMCVYSSEEAAAECG